MAALLVAGVIGIASLFDQGRYFLRHYIKLIFLASIIIVFSLGSYFSFQQYKSWQDDSLAKFLLPPHQGIDYFVSYSLVHFFAPYLISLIIALLFMRTATIFNRRRGEVFFEKEEPYLAAISFFLVGHPGWLIYLIVLILIYLLIHASRFVIRRQSERLPLYHLWAPTTVFVILLNEYWLSSTQWWPLLSL